MQDFKITFQQTFCSLSFENFLWEKLLYFIFKMRFKIIQVMQNGKLN